MSGMLREPQHDRKTFNEFKTRPVRPFDELRAGSERRRRTPAEFFSCLRTQINRTLFWRQILLDAWCRFSYFPASHHGDSRQSSRRQFGVAMRLLSQTKLFLLLGSAY